MNGHNIPRDEKDLVEKHFSKYYPDYRLLKYIGTGSAGTLWLSQLNPGRSLGPIRTLKVIPKSVVTPGGSKKTMWAQVESEALGELRNTSTSNRHLIRIYNHILDQHYVTYEMDAADTMTDQGAVGLQSGSSEYNRTLVDTYKPDTLRHRIEDNVLTAESAMQLGIEIGGALMALHVARLCHGDVKPDNIVYVNGVSKLADIGLLTHVDVSKAGPSHWRGTPGYVLESERPSPQTDVKALGRTLYNAVTGLHPTQYPKLGKASRDDEYLAPLNRVIDACFESEIGLDATEFVFSLKRERSKHEAKPFIRTGVLFGLICVSLLLLVGIIPYIGFWPHLRFEINRFPERELMTGHGALTFRETRVPFQIRDNKAEINTIPFSMLLRAAEADISVYRYEALDNPATINLRPFGETRVLLRPINVPVEGEDWMIPGLSLFMRWIDPGEFSMGNPAPRNELATNQRDECPQFPVSISRGFWMGIHEVTQEQYDRLADKVKIPANPSKFSGQGDLPVNSVKWGEATGFCEALTVLEAQDGRLRSDYIYSLPSEALWEYVARAGSQSDIATDELSLYAWYDENSDMRPHRVGTKLPNEFGIFDILGNVTEWCLDWYGTPYPTQSSTNYIAIYEAPGHEGKKVLRGGSWQDPGPVYCRITERGSFRSDLTGGPEDVRADSGQIGFRICLMHRDLLAEVK